MEKLCSNRVYHLFYNFLFLGFLLHDFNFTWSFIWHQWLKFVLPYWYDFFFFYYFVHFSHIDSRTEIFGWTTFILFSHGINQMDTSFIIPFRHLCFLVTINATGCWMMSIDTTDIETASYCMFFIILTIYTRVCSAHTHFGWTIHLSFLVLLFFFSHLDSYPYINCLCCHWRWYP